MPKVPVWALVVAGAVSVLLYLRFAPAPTPVYIPGPTSIQKVYTPKYYPKIQRELVPVHGTIEFLRKEDVQKQLKTVDVPDNVITVGEVPPHTGKTTVISSLTQQDNVWRGSLTFRQEPPPFFQVKRDMGIRAGYGTNGVIGEVYIRPLRVGPVEIEARVFGHTDNPTVGAAALVDMRF